MGQERVFLLLFVIFCCVSESVNFYHDTSESHSIHETEETVENNPSYESDFPASEESYVHWPEWNHESDHNPIDESLSIAPDPYELEDYREDIWSHMTQSSPEVLSSQPNSDDDFRRLLSKELRRHRESTDQIYSTTETLRHHHHDEDRHRHQSHRKSHGGDQNHTGEHDAHNNHADNNHADHKDHNTHDAHDHDNHNSHKDHATQTTHDKDHETHKEHHSHGTHKDQDTHKAHNAYDVMGLEWQERFCQEASHEEEEPFMVKDGSFHPRYEEVLGVGVYRLHAHARSWSDARRVCEREGAQLAVPNSREEALALADIHNRCPHLLPTHFNDYQYLGVHDEYNEGGWETVVGHSLNETGYVNWAFNQPDNAHHYGENCLTMNRNSFFNDVPCWTELPFICEHS